MSNESKYELINFTLTLVLSVGTMCAFIYMANKFSRQPHDERPAPVAAGPAPGLFKYAEVDGHEYLVWQYGKRGGITHSPNCKCARKDTPREQ